MLRKLLKPPHNKALILAATLALGFGIAEVAVRATGRFDSAGNFVFKNRVIHPLKLPLAAVNENLRLLHEPGRATIVHDPVAGWVPRPDSASANGLYRYNSQGLRSPVAAYADRPDSGVLRLALFGDSFTHGDDVPYEDSFGATLERLLNERGRPAEVLNFGVGGYGLDQALLRYLGQGVAFHPDIVVMGFQPENLKRNLNLLRPLYDPRTTLPFFKPRYVVHDSTLRLINYPVPPPETVPGVLGDLANWDLLPFEHIYDPADYRDVWWRRSKLLATVADVAFRRDDPWLRKRIGYSRQGEEVDVGGAVINIFAREAAAAGSRFLILHLPTQQEMVVAAKLGH